jgi:hypothetical protein
MTKPPLDPGFTEEDIQALVALPKFLAAARGYAEDLIPMGWATSEISRKKQARQFPEKFQLNNVITGRAFHEIARRIRHGVLVVSPEIVASFPEFTGRPDGVSDEDWMLWPFFTYSEMEAAPPDLKPFRMTYETYDDEDFSEIVKDEHLLACIDAYRQNIITLGEATFRRFGDIAAFGSHWAPRTLSVHAYWCLVCEIGDRMDKGQMLPDPTWRQRFPDAYAPATFE